MLVTCVHVWVKPGCVEEFIRACGENHRNSIKEPGNLRFDFLQHRDDPARFMLYEAYDSPESAAAHKNTAHYLEWRDTVAPLMAKPREGVPYHILCPADKALW